MGLLDIIPTHWKALIDHLTTRKRGLPIIDAQQIFFTSTSIHKHMRKFPFVRKLHDFWPSRFAKKYCNSNNFHLYGSVSVAISGSSKPVFDAIWSNNVADQVEYLQHCASWVDMSERKFLEDIPQMFFLKNVKSFTSQMIYPDTNEEASTPRGLSQCLTGLQRKGECCFEMDLSWLQVEHTRKVVELHNKVNVIIQPIAPGSDLELLAQLAAIPNIYVKLSPAEVCSPSDNEVEPDEILKQALELFGPDRCMFASNFPLSVAHEVLNALTEDEQDEFDENGVLKKFNADNPRVSPDLPHELYEAHVFGLRNAILGLGYSEEDANKVLCHTAERVYYF